MKKKHLTTKDISNILSWKIKDLIDYYGVSKRTIQYWRKEFHEEGAPYSTPVSSIVKERGKVSLLRGRIRELESQLIDNELFREFTELDVGIQDGYTKKPTVIEGNSVWMTALSDIHYGEVVEPAAMLNTNEYNMDIADARLEEYFTGIVHGMCLVEENPADLVLCFAGDFLSGNIHDELRETNDAPVTEALLRLEVALVRGIQHLLENTECKIFIPCVKGNHSRLGEKRYKQKSYDNFEHIIYHHIKRIFKDEKRIHMEIADSDELIFRVNSTTYMLEHGDNYRSVAQLEKSIKHKKSIYKSVNVESSSGDSLVFDKVILGHFHTMTINNHYLMMGSIVGPNEYSVAFNLGYEEPKMLLWLNDSILGETMYQPIHCSEKRGDPHLQGIEVFK